MILEVLCFGFGLQSSAAPCFGQNSTKLFTMSQESRHVRPQGRSSRIDHSDEVNASALLENASGHSQHVPYASLLSPCLIVFSSQLYCLALVSLVPPNSFALQSHPTVGHRVLWCKLRTWRLKILLIIHARALRGFVFTLMHLASYSVLILVSVFFFIPYVSSNVSCVHSGSCEQFWLSRAQTSLHPFQIALLVKYQI